MGELKYVRIQTSQCIPWSCNLNQIHKSESTISFYIPRTVPYFFQWCRHQLQQNDKYVEQVRVRQMFQMFNMPPKSQSSLLLRHAVSLTSKNNKWANDIPTV